MGKSGLSRAERERYVRWWREQSGLSETELRKIATGVWADRVLERDATDREDARAA